MRVFDVMACGGFALVEHSSALEELFEIGKEVETYRTQRELLEKTAYYLEHREEALKIAEAGRKAVQSNHTISNRVEHMLETVLNDRGNFRIPAKRFQADTK